MRIGTFAYLVTGPPHSTIQDDTHRHPRREGRQRRTSAYLPKRSKERATMVYSMVAPHSIKLWKDRVVHTPPPRVCEAADQGRPSTSAPDARATPGRRGGAPRTNRTRLTPRLSAHQVVTSGHHYIIERLNPQGTRAGDALRVRSSSWKYPGS